MRFEIRLLVATFSLAAMLLIACGSDSNAIPTPPATPAPTPATPTATLESTVSTATPEFEGGPPTWPQLYSGFATAAGQPVPEGLTVIARVGRYESPCSVRRPAPDTHRGPTGRSEVRLIRGQRPARRRRLRVLRQSLAFLLLLVREIPY